MPDPGRLPRVFHARRDSGEHDQPCLLLDHEQIVVERVLVLHDEQLAAVPKFRYLEAWDQLQRFVTGGTRSPIPLATAG